MISTSVVNGKRKPPGPLRQARAQALLELIRQRRRLFLDQDQYRLCRNWCGLTAAQIDVALGDLAAVGQVVLAIRSGLVPAELPKAAAEKGDPPPR